MYIINIILPCHIIYLRPKWISGKRFALAIRFLEIGFEQGPKQQKFIKMLTSIASSSSTMLLCPKLGGTCSMSFSTTSSYSKTQHFYLHSLGHRLFSPWNGLKNLGFSIKPKKPFFRIIGIILAFNFYSLFWVFHTLLYYTILYSFCR